MKRPVVHIVLATLLLAAPVAVAQTVSTPAKTEKAPKKSRKCKKTGSSAISACQTHGKDSEECKKATKSAEDC